MRGAHLTLDGDDGAVGVGDGLTLGDLAHQTLAVLGEGDQEGVVRAPSALGITVGSPPSMTATQLLVVPRSIPMILDICFILLKMLARLRKFGNCRFDVCKSGRAACRGKRPLFGDDLHHRVTKHRALHLIALEQDLADRCRVRRPPARPCITAFSRLGSNLSPLRLMGVMPRFSNASHICLSTISTPLLRESPRRRFRPRRQWRAPGCR